MMKASRTIFTAIAMAVIACSATSCYFRISDKVKAELNKITWGEERTITIGIEPFRAIDCQGSIPVQFIQTDTVLKVEVIGKTNLVDSISAEVIDSVLTIKYLHDYVNVGNEEVIVYAPSVQAIVSSGSGDFTISNENGFKGDTLVFTTLGSGNAELGNIKVTGSFVMSSMGSGDIIITGLEADTASVSGAGSGNIEVREADVNNILCATRGSGDLFAIGKAGKVTVTKAGSGNIDLSRFNADEVKIEGDFGSGEIVQNPSWKKVSGK